MGEPAPLKRLTEAPFLSLDFTMIVFATGLPPIASTGADVAENRPAKIGATSSSLATAVSAFSLSEERGWSCRSALNGRVSGCYALFAYVRPAPR
jgi:hypothetical protein